MLQLDCLLIERWLFVQPIFLRTNKLAVMISNVSDVFLYKRCSDDKEVYFRKSKINGTQ